MEWNIENTLKNDTEELSNSYPTQTHNNFAPSSFGVGNLTHHCDDNDEFRIGEFRISPMETQPSIELSSAILQNQSPLQSEFEHTNYDGSSSTTVFATPMVCDDSETLHLREKLSELLQALAKYYKFFLDAPCVAVCRLPLARKAALQVEINASIEKELARLTLEIILINALPNCLYPMVWTLLVLYGRHVLLTQYFNPVVLLSPSPRNPKVRPQHLCVSRSL